MAARPDPDPAMSTTPVDRIRAEAKSKQTTEEFSPSPRLASPSPRRWALVVVIAVLALAASGWYVVPWMVPMPTPLVTDHGTATRPQPIGSRTPANASNAPDLSADQVAPVPYEQLSPNLIAATIAAQDPGFWNHGGTDSIRVWREVGKGVKAGRLATGGSTITEQLAKMSAHRATGRSIKTRLADALTARRIEMAWSKEQILEEYLARLPYGNNHTGVTAAAAGYFGKSPADLSLAESTFLAVLPDAPSRLDPYRHFDAAKQRQEAVLKQMLATGAVPAAEARQAILEPLKLRPVGSDQ